MKHFFCFIILIFLTILSYSQNKNKRSGQYVLPEFSEGIILLQNGVLKSGLLNYNALANNFAIKKDETIFALSEYDLKNLDTVYVDNRKFFKLDGQISELLLKSKIELYAKYNCNLKSAATATSGYGGSSQANSSANLNSYEDQGFTYILELPERYSASIRKTYFLKKDNKIYSFESLGQLKKLYRDNQKEIKSYRKTNDIDFDLTPSIVKLIQHLEAL